MSPTIGQAGSNRRCHAYLGLHPPSLQGHGRVAASLWAAEDLGAFLGLGCGRHLAREQRLVGDYLGVGLQEGLRKPAEVVSA